MSSRTKTNVEQATFHLRDTRSSIVLNALILVKSNGGGIRRCFEPLPFEPFRGCVGRGRDASVEGTDTDTGGAEVIVACRVAASDA